VADDALFDAIRSHLRPGIPLREYDCAINDPVFARACAGELLASLGVPSVHGGAGRCQERRSKR
jgi:hypothetical protein